MLNGHLNLVAQATEGKSPSDIVTAMCKEFDNPGGLAPEKCADYFTDDIVWHGDPSSKPVVGLEKIKKAMKPNPNMISKGWIITNQVATGDTVFNERIDKFDIKGKSGKMHSLRAPVIGVFKIRGDKICEWRDYADTVGKGKDGSLVDIAKKQNP